MEKSRVAPLNIVSIPCLELIAATLSAKILKLIRKTSVQHRKEIFLDCQLSGSWISTE